MAFELIYTSAERGLRPGTRGFCTVAHTKGMLPQTVQLLEALSAYKNLYAINDGGQDAPEPVAWSHITNHLAGRNVSVVSRVGPTAADHTGRSNKLAHHVLINQRERPAGGPAWLSAQPGFFQEAWSGTPHLIDTPKTIPEGDIAPAPAHAWAAVTGDAAYAALPANAFLANPDGLVIIAFAPGSDMLPLISESLALLEPAQRWRVTYSTYFTMLAAGATCAWRCCIAGSDALRDARRNPRATIIDLTGQLPTPPTGPLADMARDGRPHPNPTKQEPPTEQHTRKFILLSNRNINMLNLKPRKPDI